MLNKNRFLALKRFNDNKLMITLGIGIFLIFFSVFVIYPLIFSIIASFSKWDPFQNTIDFIGLNNYIRAFSDKLVWRAILNTFYFASVAVIFRIIFGLFLAVVIFSIKRFSSFFKTIFFLPTVVPLFATAVVWKWLYDPGDGIFNLILGFFGLPHMLFMLSDTQSMPSIIFMTIWKDFGFSMILFLAGLSTIPKTYLEAAEIDGASKIKIFWHIQLPLLKPTMVFVTVISMISYLQIFLQVFIMSSKGGGSMGLPDSTMTIAYRIYEQAFKRNDFGYATSIAVILFLIILIFSLVQIRLMRINWRY